QYSSKERRGEGDNLSGAPASYLWQIMNPVLLLVDDDEAIRTQMKWALSADYEIVSAEDRAGAVENFKKKKPAVTLLDLGLPPRPTDPDESRDNDRPGAFTG